MLTFFIPFKLLTGYYPPQAYAIFFFLALGFMVGFQTLIHIKNDYFPDMAERLLLFSGLMFGFTTNALFLLSMTRVYEVAIAATFCFMMLALFFLYKFIHHFRLRESFLLGLCLSLIMAGRPNFILVCAFLILAVAVYLWKYAPRRQWILLMSALVIFPLCMGVVLGLYNYYRFDSVLEFGLRYQLVSTERIDLLFNMKMIFQNIGYGLPIYLFQPFSIIPVFPFISIYNIIPQYLPLYYQFESAVGIFITSPFIVILIRLPRLFHFYLGKKQHNLLPLFWFVAFLLGVAIIAIAFILTLSGVAERFVSDFLPYLVLAAIITFWLYEKYSLRRFSLVKVGFLLAAVVSIFFGMNLGVSQYYSYYYYMKNITR